MAPVATEAKAYLAALLDSGVVGVDMNRPGLSEAFLLESFDNIWRLHTPAGLFELCRRDVADPVE